jgi:predicted AAA+ superfamily ATPase
LITLLEDPNIKYDIYITGSNSKMLSSELGSELTGRHIDFTILPIDFFSMKKIMSSNQNENEKLAKYSFFGGLGNTVEFYDDEDSLRSLLTTILNDSISKDIFKRHRVKNKTVFEDFLTYVFKNIGQPLSVINTAQYFKSNKISNTDFSTLSTYLK